MRALMTQRGILTLSANLLTGKSYGVGLRDVDIPRPKLAKNEVLIRFRAVALNPIDAKLVDFIAPPGGIAGYDFAGEIEEIGEDAPGT